MFDVNNDGLNENQKIVADWATAHASSFRLRLASGEHSYGDLTGMIDAVKVKTPGKKGNYRVVPASPTTFYRATANSPPGDPWWNYVFAKEWTPTTGGWDMGFRHQFIIFGGEDPNFAPASSPGGYWTGKTFLQTFLTDDTSFD
jgi:hypothetical protein